MFITDGQWLTITNMALGVVVIIAVAVVGSVFASELYEKYHKKVLVKSIPHEMFTDDLGMLFADGGEEIKAEDLKDYHL